MQHLVDQAKIKLVPAPAASDLDKFDAVKLANIVKELLQERTKVLALVVMPKADDPAQVRCSAAMR